MKANALNIMITHNHPSGSTKPFEADKIMTRKIRQVGEQLDIKLLDHLIITAESYYSFTYERSRRTVIQYNSAGHDFKKFISKHRNDLIPDKDISYISIA